MAEGVAPFYVLQNYGTNRNCTLSASFPAVVAIEGIDVGGQKGNVNYDVSRITYGLEFLKVLKAFCSIALLKCDQQDALDRVTVGGSSGLDSHHITKATTICGKTDLNGPEQAVFCGVTSVRLESSGKYNNKVVVSLRPADEEDISLATAVCDL